MNLFHLSTARTWRGGEQQIAYLATELQHYSTIQQWVVCVQKSDLANYCKKHQIPYFTYAKISPFNLYFAYQLNRLCQNYKIDLIHLHDPHAHNFAVLSAYFFQNQTPLILSRRVDLPVRKHWYTSYKYNYPTIKQIVCVSKMIENILAPAIQDKNKLRTIYSGISMDRFNNSKFTPMTLQMEYNLPIDIPLIGNVSALAAHKDYFTFVDTAKLLVNRGIKAHFFIIGAGEERDAIEAYININQLKKHITLTGFRTDIPQILPQFTVFLMTSKTEGLGTTILDAYACGVPVVATKAGGIPELVIDGETGLLSPIQQAAELADRVALLLTDQALGLRLTKQARERVKLFTTKRVAELMVETYKVAIS